MKKSERDKLRATPGIIIGMKYTDVAELLDYVDALEKKNERLVEALKTSRIELVKLIESDTFYSGRTIVERVDEIARQALAEVEDGKE